MYLLRWSCSQIHYRMPARILSESCTVSSCGLNSTITRPVSSQQQLATLRTRARRSNTPFAMHHRTAPAGTLPCAVRTLACSSMTAVEASLIVLVFQAAYLGCDHCEVVCADKNRSTRRAVVPASPV